MEPMTDYEIEQAILGISDAMERQKHMSQITHETRRESLEDILEDLGGRQTAILWDLFLCGEDGVTASELAKRMHEKGMFPTADRNFVHPRLNELVTAELVEVIGKRSCNVTGKTCALYRVKDEFRQEIIKTKYL